MTYPLIYVTPEGEAIGITAERLERALERRLDTFNVRPLPPVKDEPRGDGGAQAVAEVV